MSTTDSSRSECEAQSDFSALYALLDEETLHSRLDESDALGPVLADLGRGVQAAMDTWDLPALSRLSFAYPRLKLRAVLRLLPLLEKGDYREAAFRAGFLHSENKRAKALLFIAHHACRKGRLEEAGEILAQALQLKGTSLVREEKGIFLPAIRSFLAAELPGAEDLLFTAFEPVHAVHSAVKLSREGNLPDEVRRSLLTRAAEHLYAVMPERLRAWAAADLRRELDAAGEAEKAAEVARIALPDEQCTEQTGVKEGLEERLRALVALPVPRGRIIALCPLLRDLAAHAGEPPVPELFEKAVALIPGTTQVEEDFRDLLDAASALREAGRQDWTIRVLAGLLEAAGALANRSLKARMLSITAAGLYRAGDAPQSFEVFDKALLEAGEVLELQQRSLLFFWIAGDLALLEESSRSDAIAVSALLLEEEALRECTAYFTLSSIANCLSSLEDTQRLRETMSRHLALAEEVPEHHQRAGVFVALATCLWSFEERDWSREVFGKALECALKTADRYMRARALAAVAENYSICGLAGDARECFDRAHAAALEIVKEGPRMETLSFLAGKLAALGEKSRAREILAGAFESLGAGDTPSRGRVEALASLAAVKSAVDEREEALGILARALALAGRIEKPWDAAWARNAVVKGLLAAQSFEEAVDIARSITDLAPVADAKISCARFAAAFRPEEALPLLRGLLPVSEMNRGIGEVALDLTRDGVPPRGKRLELLRVLTLLALEDWFLCDFVVSRWVAIITDREALHKTCLELGRFDPDHPHPPAAGA